MWSKWGVINHLRDQVENDDGDDDCAKVGGVLVAVFGVSSLLQLEVYLTVEGKVKDSSTFGWLIFFFKISCCLVLLEMTFKFLYLLFFLLPIINFLFSIVSLFSPSDQSNFFCLRTIIPTGPQELTLFPFAGAT